MSTSQVTIFSFAWITIHQSYITHDPIRQSPSSNLKMVGCHLFCLLPISVKKTRDGNHTIESKQEIMTSLNFSSHQTHIINMSQKKKLLKNSQEHSESILLKIPPSHNKNPQSYMSNSLHTCIITIYLNFLFLLSSS